MRNNQDPTSQQPTILLVDDEEFLRRLLARVLASAGFNVIQAENGAAALGAASGLDALKLVVTDIHMPVMDGIEFAREFRPHHPTVPVLFITGREPGISDDPALFDDHLLRKPFGNEAFLAAVSRLLGHSSESLGRDHSVA
jgi:CheY-like chemotaxis protein